MAITLKKKNFAKSTLASGITDTANQLIVATGHGAKFPSTGPFRAVLWSSSVSAPSGDENAEIVTATLNASDTFDIVREQEGTTKKAWSQNDNFAHINTAGAMQEIEDEINQTNVPIGVPLPYFGASAPARHLLCDGKTIGDATSGGTARANADTQTLFELLWGAFANTELIIQDSSGNPTTRGASASADFAAHKRMPIPDIRGRGLSGKDNMGGTSANRVTNAQADLEGGSMGEETHILSEAEMPAHVHDYTFLVGAGSDVNTVGGTAAYGTSQTGSKGSGSAHNNMQPTMFLNFIVRYI